MRFTNTLSRVLGDVSLSVVDLPYIVHSARKAASALRACARQTAHTCNSVATNSFILRTLSEFLKCTGAPIVLLFIQSLFAILMITVVITAIAVLVERHAERHRRVSDNPSLDSQQMNI